MNFMAVSSSSLGLASHFNPKRGGTKAQQTVIWAMKLAKNRKTFTLASLQNREGIDSTTSGRDT